MTETEVHSHFHVARCLMIQTTGLDPIPLAWVIKKRMFLVDTTPNITLCTWVDVKECIKLLKSNLKNDRSLNKNLSMLFTFDF